MSFQLSLWEVLSLIGGLSAGFMALGRMLIGLAERRLDERFEAMEDSRQATQAQWLEQFSNLNQNARQTELRFAQLLADLPLQYQRREDAIRQEVAIIARLDALAGKVDRALSCEMKICPVHDILEARQS